ncbi:MAG: FtsW/RodA/SpoVE family cell cycle protein, partial [Phycisphaerales bacterium]|nr:FtsW/RodA/SpoVE family cell cycle protein [Phycisphaerales bacterium]
MDRLRPADVLTLCVLTLLCLGVLMVQSAAMQVTGDPGWGWTERGLRHIAYATIAAATFLVVSRWDYAAVFARQQSWLSNPGTWLFGASLLLCAIVLIPGIGKEVNGARRWLLLGPLQIQPSELAKWSIVLFLAVWLTRPIVDLTRFRNLLLTLAPVAAACLLIVIEDFGTAVLVGMGALAMLLCSRVRKWQLLALLPLVLGAAAWFILHKEYRLRRMLAFLDPWASPRSEGYHMVQSLLSFSTGGITGRGLGNGVQKLGYLPEDTTDFIFAVICEELGLPGALLVMAMYLGILYVAWQSIRSNRDSLGRMLAFGMSAMLGLQAALNIAVATVSVPTKGLSLPLVSA